MPVLTAQELRKAYGAHAILDGVSLAIGQGERVGLVGINGSGKSTLARVLAGIEAPDGGTVTSRRDAKVLYLSQEPSFPGDPTAAEAVTEGLAEWAAARAEHERICERIAQGGTDLDELLAAQDRSSLEVERLGGWDLEHRARTMMSHLGVGNPDARVANLSGGERRRIDLARVLVAAPALAILDEPTNHLDIDAIEWLERFLCDDYAGALLLITHDRYLLDRVVRRTLELDRGVVHSYDGGWQRYLEAKSERLALEARTEKNRQNFLRTEIEWLRRGPKARTTKQKARIDRAEAAIAAAPIKQRNEIGTLKFHEERQGGLVLELEGVAIARNGRQLVGDLDLVLQKGDRVGVVGPNGSGKTSLLKVLLGELAPAAGSVRLGKRTSVAYLAQDRALLDPEATILENVAGKGDKVTAFGQTFHVSAWLDRFLFDGTAQRKKVKVLSGGERARVALAKMLLTSANVVVMDEPTNDLDVSTLGALEAMLLDLEGTAVVVTHDRYFLDRVATAILAFEGDGRVVRYPGNYTMYRDLRAQSEAEATAAATRADAPSKSAPVAASERAKAKRSLTYAEELELKALMPRIEEAEARVVELETTLADPDLYRARGAEVPVLQSSLAEARASLETMLARWETLETKRG